MHREGGDKDGVGREVHEQQLARLIQAACGGESLNVEGA